MLCPVSTKIEKEKKEHARQHGMIRTEISGAEIAEEMEKERRFFQLQMCEVSLIDDDNDDDCESDLSVGHSRQ